MPFLRIVKDSLSDNNQLTEDIITGNIEEPKKNKEEGVQYIINLGNQNFAYGHTYGKSFNIDNIIKKIRKTRPDMEISNMAHIIYSRFFLKIDDAMTHFNYIIENFNGFQINQEYQGHFTSPNIDKLFAVQNLIYNKLIESNIYN